MSKKYGFSLVAAALVLTMAGCSDSGEVSVKDACADFETSLVAINEKMGAPPEGTELEAFEEDVTRFTGFLKESTEAVSNSELKSTAVEWAEEASSRMNLLVKAMTAQSEGIDLLEVQQSMAEVDKTLAEKTQELANLCPNLSPILGVSAEETPQS